jgi:hypothetical protein
MAAPAVRVGSSGDVAALSLLEAPTAILTVENYASFNRQVREIEDGSLVV